MSKASRERRFEATARVIQCRSSDHRHLDHPAGKRPAHCYCEDAGRHLWAKRKVRSCHCSKRLRGQPKLGKGICGIEKRARIYDWRREDRELRRLAWEPDSDEIWLLGSPKRRNGMMVWTRSG